MTMGGARIIHYFAIANIQIFPDVVNATLFIDEFWGLTRFGIYKNELINRQIKRNW